MSEGRARAGAGLLTAGPAGEAAVVVEVAHGLASLVCSVHPFAALHAGSCKRQRAREVRSRVWAPTPQGMLLMEAAVTIQPAGRRPSAKSKLHSRHKALALLCSGPEGGTPPPGPHPAGDP